ncbi:MAG: SH3 domain-containing protein [Candidatus Promineifilaceae bacterium]
MRARRVPVLTLWLLGLVMAAWPGAQLAAAVPGGQAGVPVADQGAGVVNVAALNVRAGPGYYHPVVAILYRGQKLVLIGRNVESNWLHMRIAGSIEGWVQAGHVEAGLPLAALPVTAAPEGAAEATTATPAFLPLALRAAPGVNHAALLSLSGSERLMVLGRNIGNSWLFVQTASGQQGWVNTAAVVIEGPLTAAPLQTAWSLAATDPAVAAPPAEAPAQEATAVVATGALNVRSGPGRSYAKVTVVVFGQDVKLLRRNADGSWVQVRLSDGVEGWVNFGMLESTVDVLSLPVEGAAAPQATAVIDISSLNVRRGPGVLHPIVIIARRGDSVALLGRNAEATWVQIRTPSAAVGWVNIRHLATSYPAQSLPVTG